MKSLCIILVILTSLGQPYFVSVFLEQFCEFHKISSQSFSQDLAIQFSLLSFCFPFLILHSRRYSPSSSLSCCLILGGLVINILFVFQNSYASLFYSLLLMIKRYTPLLACSLGILSILKGLIWNYCFNKKDLHKAKSIESFFVALFSNSSIFVFGSLIN